MTWPEVIKLYFMLNLTEHEISTAYKTNVLRNMEFPCFKTFRSCIYPAYKCLNTNNCCHFTIDEQDKFHCGKSFITFGFELLLNEIFLHTSSYGSGV